MSFLRGNYHSKFMMKRPFLSTLYTLKNATGLLQVATGLSISSRCNKFFKTKSFADLLQLVEEKLQKPCWNNQLARSLLTTCNRLILSQAVASHANAYWYRLVVTICYKMSINLLQLARFWPCMSLLIAEILS